MKLANKDYDITMAASYLGVSVSTVRNYIRRGFIKSYRRFGTGKIYIKKKELTDFMNGEVMFRSL